MTFWGRGHDHIGDFNFRVEIEGLGVAAFKQIQGMGSETEVIEYADVPARLLRKRPGRTRYSDITFKRGQTSDPYLWDWRKQVIDGHIERKSGSIIILDDRLEEICRWNFFDAWPTRWLGFDLNGKGSSALVEELTITLEWLERDGRPVRSAPHAMAGPSRRSPARAWSVRSPGRAAGRGGSSRGRGSSRGASGVSSSGRGSGRAGGRGQHA